MDRIYPESKNEEKKLSEIGLDPLKWEIVSDNENYLVLVKIGKVATIVICDKKRGIIKGAIS